MTSRLSITGIGLVTPLGRSAPASWQALLAGQHITEHTRLVRAVHPQLPRVASLAIEAANEAIAHAGWKQLDDRNTAIVACTSKGPVEDWIRPAIATSDNVDGGASAFGMAGLSAALADHLGLSDGPRLTLSSACAGGLQALVRAALLIRNSEANRVLVVASEASVHPLFLASFKRLGVLSPPGDLCRPFDVHRQGFLMSEAAAAVCLESNADRPLVHVDRVAMGGDAISLTGSDPDAAVLCRLIRDVSTDQPFDLIHAHGTGTPMNDATELAAFERTLPNGGAGASLFSHKAALGHTLGASGLVSIVLSVLAHRTGTVPPNINTTSPVTTRLRLTDQIDRRPVSRSLTNAAGFGGGVATLSLQTP